MITEEQLDRIATMARMYIEELPDDDALDMLVLLFDVCEILELRPERMEAVFGAEVLRWVTGVVYAFGGRFLEKTSETERSCIR